MSITRSLLACGLTVASLFVAAFASTAPRTLEQALDALPERGGQGAIPNLVYDSDRQTGMAYGAQVGLAKCAHDDLEEMRARADVWDKTFAFSSLIMDGNILPAVITKMSEVISQPDDTTFKVTGRVYRIDQQPRFVYTAPTWRTYYQVLETFEEPSVPASRPEDAARLSVWKQAVREGYDKGCKQAKEIGAQQFARLRRDWDGMNLYYQLLDEKLVTRPFVVSSKNEIIRDDAGNLHLDEVTLRIATNPDFVDRAEGWADHVQGQRGGAAIAERLRQAARAQMLAPPDRPKVNRGRYAE